MVFFTSVCDINDICSKEVFLRMKQPGSTEKFIDILCVFPDEVWDGFLREMVLRVWLMIIFTNWYQIKLSFVDTLKEEKWCMEVLMHR